MVHSSPLNPLVGYSTRSSYVYTHQFRGRVQSSVCFIVTYFFSCCKVTPEPHSFTDQQTTSILQFKNQPVILIPLFLCYPSISLLCWCPPTHIFSSYAVPVSVLLSQASPGAYGKEWAHSVHLQQSELALLDFRSPEELPWTCNCTLSSSILTHNPSLQSPSYMSKSSLVQALINIVSLVSFISMLNTRCHREKK